MRRHAQSNPSVGLIWLGYGAIYIVVGAVLWWFYPAVSLAQDTGPVTVTIRFDDEVSFGAACVPRSTLCASERNSSALFNEILLPGISTAIEKAEIDQQRRKSLFPLKRQTAGEKRLKHNPRS